MPVLREAMPPVPALLRLPAFPRLAEALLAVHQPGSPLLFWLPSRPLLRRLRLRRRLLLSCSPLNDASASRIG